MAETDELWAGQVFARRLREVRKRRGWSQEQLARRVDEELGVPIHRVTIAKIESGGKRAQHVELQEVLALSLALGVSPLHMIVPFGADARLRVAPRKQAVGPVLARRWLQGVDTLLDEDPRWFFTEVPPDEWEALRQAASEVRLGEDASPQAFFARQFLAERGELPSIVPQHEPDPKEASA